MLTNPATFVAEGIRFTATSVDTLMDLSKTGTLQLNLVLKGEVTVSRFLETARNASGDRMARFAKHVLDQRSVYPLYPPGKDVNIDIKHYSQLDIDEKPDVLILPSALSPFIKVP